MHGVQSRQQTLTVLLLLVLVIIAAIAAQQASQAGHARCCGVGSYCSDAEWASRLGEAAEPVQGWILEDWVASARGMTGAALAWLPGGQNRCSRSDS